jgi:hypothetical protein
MNVLIQKDTVMHRVRRALKAKGLIIRKGGKLSGFKGFYLVENDVVIAKDVDPMVLARELNLIRPYEEVAV